jgi:hypothetical protein
MFTKTVIETGTVQIAGTETVHMAGTAATMTETRMMVGTATLTVTRTMIRTATLIEMVIRADDGIEPRRSHRGGA